MNTGQINTIMSIATDARFLTLNRELKSIGLKLNIVPSQKEEHTIVSNENLTNGLKKHWEMARNYAKKNNVSIIKARSAVKNKAHISDSISKSRMIYWAKVHKIQEEKGVSVHQARKLYKIASR